MTERITVSACLIVRDEEKNLAECLDSLRHVVDEIIVVDTGSRDRTADVARAGGAQVFHFPWQDDFAQARNVALDKAKGDWILVLDADERLSSDGYASFREPLRNPERWGYTVTLVNLLEDRSSEVLLLRIFRNLPEIYYTGMIHERVDLSIMDATGDIRNALGMHPAKIFHTGYQEQIKKEKKKDERDIRLLKKQIEADGEDPFYWYKFAAHPYAREHLKQEVEDALERAWGLIMKQDRESRLYSFTPEVAALRILSALGARNPMLSLSIARETDRFVFTSPNLHYALGQCRLLHFELSRAAAHFKEALACHGRNALCAPIDGVTDCLSLNALSEVRFLQQRREESKRLHLEALSLRQQGLTHLFFSPVEELIESGDPGWAMLVLSQAVQVRDNDPELWQRGGLILAALGFETRAMPWFEKAKALSLNAFRV
ncbi:MAG: glycosyltransferase family 2 protein [Planctomycetota bacterium]